MQSINSESLQFLVDEGISRGIFSGAPEELRRANFQGQTPLFLSCKHGRLEVAHWLFGAGAAEDVRTADNYGCTPMLLAYWSGHLKVHSGSLVWVLPRTCEQLA
jgi:ankyrin repeat protein